MKSKFQLNNKLAGQLQRYSADAKIPVEFLVEDALKVAISSADDRTVIAHLQDDYEEAVKKKTRCGVVLLESKVTVEFDAETDRRAKLLMELEGGIPLDELIERLLNRAHRNHFGGKNKLALERAGGQ